MAILRSPSARVFWFRGSPIVPIGHGPMGVSAERITGKTGRQSQREVGASDVPALVCAIPEVTSLVAQQHHQQKRLPGGLSSLTWLEGARLPARMNALPERRWWPGR